MIRKEMIRMETKMIAKKVAVITKLCIMINEKGKYDAFLRFSGHVNEIEVNLYEGGFDKEKEPIEIRTYMDKADTEVRLNGIIAYLEEKLYEIEENEQVKELGEEDE